MNTRRGIILAGIKDTLLLSNPHETPRFSDLLKTH